MLTFGPLGRLQHTRGNKQAEEEAKKDAERQIDAIKKAGDAKGDEVVKELLRLVTDVRPELPDRIAAAVKE